MKTAMPRSVPVYFADDVVAFLHAAEGVDVSPYLKSLFDANYAYGADQVIRVCTQAPNFKHRELKEAIYKYFGGDVHIFYNLDPDHWLGIIDKGV